MSFKILCASPCLPWKMIEQACGQAPNLNTQHVLSPWSLHLAVAVILPQHRKGIGLLLSWFDCCIIPPGRSGGGLALQVGLAPTLALYSFCRLSGPRIGTGRDELVVSAEGSQKKGTDRLRQIPPTRQTSPNSHVAVHGDGDVAVSFMSRA